MTFLLWITKLQAILSMTEYSLKCQDNHQANCQILLDPKGGTIKVNAQINLIAFKAAA